MQTDEILEKLKTILVEQLGLQRDRITLEANIREDLSADSLDCVELTMAVEEEFAIDLTDQEVECI